MSQRSSAAGRATRYWREIADRVYIRRYLDFNVTIGLIVGDETSLVIDTRASERQGRELADEVRWIAPGQIRVANTHHHYDRTFGNHAFLPAEIWAHEACATRLREDSRTAQFALAAAMPEVAAEYVETQITPPDKTFRDGVDLDLGDRVVHLKHLGRGHTDNDIVVVLPDAQVVFAGDLVEQGGPPSFEDSFPLDWPGTLGRMLDMVDGAVVPGHGEVITRAFVEGQLADLSALAQLARRVSFDGGSVADALPMSPFPPASARQALSRAFSQLNREP